MTRRRRRKRRNAHGRRRGETPPSLQPRIAVVTIGLFSISLIKT